MRQVDLQRLVEVQHVTHEYAMYRHYRNGLGTVLGGMIVILVYALGLFPVSIPIMMAFTLGLTLVWLVGKEIIRRTHYQSFGHIRERWPRLLRTMHVLIVLLFVLVSGSIWWSFLTSGNDTLLQRWLPMWSTLLAMTIFPLLAWFLLRTAHELVIGTYLLIVTVIALSGGRFPSSLVPFIPFLGAYAIVIGIIEHRRYVLLAERLQA